MREMKIDNLKDKLKRICKSRFLGDDQRVIFPEPYIPYIPDSWNGIMVLAEAQNLAKSNNDYVAILNNMSSDQRIERLYYAVKTERRIRIQPWDDGSLQLAVEAALKVNPIETAVSNSVMWSQRKNNGTNRNPSNVLITTSMEIWAMMLKEIAPKIVVTAGAVARDLIRPIWPQKKQINLRLPSPLAMAILAGRTDQGYIESQRKTIQGLLLKYPIMFEKNKRFKELYIWHAITETNKHLNDDA